MKEQVEQVASDAPVFEGDEGGRSDHLVGSDGTSLQWVDGNNDDSVYSDEDDHDREFEEYEPRASYEFLMRTIRCFEPRSRGVSREQLSEMRRKWAVKRAEAAREAGARAQSNHAYRSRPEPTTASRPRATRTRRPPSKSHATVDPTPPPEPPPAPAAIAAAQSDAPPWLAFASVALLNRALLCWWPPHQEVGRG